MSPFSFSDSDGVAVPAEHGSCAAGNPPAAPAFPGDDAETAGPSSTHVLLPMHNLRDFRPDLHSAIDQLHFAGFDGEAYVLAASMEGAYATAVEMLAAIGGAVLRVERGLGTEAPLEVKAAFQRALAEVRKAVPSLS